MAGQKAGTVKTGKPKNVEDMGVYVNLLTDFGFKRIFGMKDVMLHFLNTVLAEDVKDVIVDLHYDNTERPGITKYDRRAIYDLICSTAKGERFIVEIQALWQEFYKDRTLFYATYLIQDQNIKKKYWDFKLQPVYSVNIVNFPFDKTALSEEKYTSYVQLIDRETHQLFYDKLTFVFIELPRFTKELHELQTFFEQWMFIIRNLHELTDIPEALRNEVFEKLFEEAKITRMTKQEKDTYFTSLKNLHAMNLAKIELGKMQKTIATMGKDLATMGKDLAAKDKALAAKEKEIAELRRRLGLN